MPNVSIASLPEVYTGWLQGKSGTRPLHLPAEPGAEVPGSHPRDQGDSQQRPTSSYTQALAIAFIKSEADITWSPWSQSTPQPVRRGIRLKVTDGSESAFMLPYRDHNNKFLSNKFHLGHHVSLMSPLLWASHRNNGEGGCLPDDPNRTCDPLQTHNSSSHHLQ